MAEVRLKVVLDGAETTISTVNQLEDALVRTKNELATLDIGSQAFKNVQAQARAIDSELKNIQKSTEGVDTTKLAGSFAKLGESVVGAFAVATSAAKLFGKESEDITKAQEQAQQTLNIVLGARAITEGVVEGAAAARLVVDKVSIITTGALTAAFGRQTVALAADAAATGTATSAQLALNTAMKLSPIGLLIGSITALIVYWDDLTEAVGLSNSELDTFNEEQKKIQTDLNNELNKALAENSNKFFELGNAIEFSTGAAQKSWIKTALKDLPELINLTGDEADAVEKVTAALRTREQVAELEAKRTRNLKEIATFEEKFIEANKSSVPVAKEVSDAWVAGVNALRAQNETINQQLGLLKSDLDATIAAEAAKKKASEDAKKAAEDAYNKRIEQIKNERKALQDLIKSTREETVKSQNDTTLSERENAARRIKNRFDQEAAILQIARDREVQEVENQRQAALEKINTSILEEKEKAKFRKQINDEYNKQVAQSDEELKKALANNEQARQEQIAKVNAAIINNNDATLAELNYGDSQFVDTVKARQLELEAFEKDLAIRKLTDGAMVERMTLAQRQKFYQDLEKLQNEALTVEANQRKDANMATLKQEQQLNQDRLDSGEITAEQFAIIDKNLRDTKAIEDEKVEKDIAQKRVAINKQTEEQILQSRIQGLQAYLGFATQGLQALSTISSTIEESRLNSLNETNNQELEANKQKNQSILDQEIARINSESGTQAEKQKKIDDAVKKSQDKKAKDDKKTEEKIEKQRNEIRKKAFARTKALNIATALVNGAQAVLQAIAQFGPPPSPLGIAGIAAAGVVTAAQVAAIASQQYQEEGGGGSTELNVPDVTAVGGDNAPASPGEGGFTLFNPDLVNVTQTGGRGAAGGGGSMGPLRVYVLESDITNAQDRVRTTVEQASFG